MKNNPKLVLYIAAGLLMFLLWDKWQIANMPQPIQETTAERQVPTDIPSATIAETGSDVPTTVASSQTSADSDAGNSVFRVKTDVLALQISSTGGTIIEADLLKYPAVKNGAEPLALMHLKNPGRFLLQSGITAVEGIAPTHHEIFTAPKQEYILADGQEKLTIPLTWEKDGITVHKNFTFKRGSYEFILQQQLENHSDKNWRGNAYEQWVFGQPKAKKGLGQVATYTGGVFSTDNDRYEKVKLGEDLNTNTNDGWVAMIQHYFLGAIVPQQGKEQEFFSRTNQKTGDHFVGVISAVRDVPAGGSTDFHTTLYVGPKIQKNLEAVAPNLDKTVDYGILFMIGQPMYLVLSAINHVVGNWGWSIVIMTILIKLLFFVPSAWAYKSMAKMRRLGPEMQRIKERCGDDRQAASVAIMQLYKKEKVNPASGCLPMLLQIPFFIAFYWVLVESVALRHAPWIGWIHDLSARDPYFILPIINAALMFVQQKLNPPPPDPMQAKIMMMLPLVFGFMFMWFPAGLVLYWTVSNAFGIVQQYVMNKRYGEKSDRHHHKSLKA